MEHTRVALVPRIRPTALFAATAACVVLGVVVWHSRGPEIWERPFIALLRHERPPMARPLLLLWQPLPLTLATLWLAQRAAKTRRALLACSGTFGCALAIGLTELFLKPLVGRHHFHAGSALFPSGHVAAAAAWAMFAWLVMDPRSQLRSALGAVPILVGWAAIATGAHYPADAIAGLFVGGVVVYCTVFAADRLAIAAGRRHRPVSAPAEAHIDLSTDAVALPRTGTDVRSNARR